MTAIDNKIIAFLQVNFSFQAFRGLDKRQLCARFLFFLYSKISPSLPQGSPIYFLPFPNKEREERRGRETKTEKKRKREREKESKREKEKQRKTKKRKSGSREEQKKEE